jgi:hypothetical protein
VDHPARRGNPDDHTNQHAHFHPNADEYTHFHLDANQHAHSHRYTNGDTHAYRYANLNPYTHTYADPQIGRAHAVSHHPGQRRLGDIDPGAERRPSANCSHHVLVGRLLWHMP